MSEDDARFWQLVEALRCAFGLSEREAQIRAAEALHPEEASRWRAEHGEGRPMTRLILCQCECLTIQEGGSNLLPAPSIQTDPMPWPPPGCELSEAGQALVCDSVMGRWEVTP